MFLLNILLFYLGKRRKESRKALEWLLLLREDAAVYTNSQALLKATQCGSADISSVGHMIDTLHWVPGHQGFVGKEEAGICA